MKKTALIRFALYLAPVLALPAAAQAAEGAAPEMLGVREVILDYARFSDPKASDTCGLGREQIASELFKALNGTGVPAVPVADAKPPVMGVARIDLIPQIDTHADDNLDCVTWVSLSAESRANAVIPPVATLRGVTVLYWRQHVMIASNQSAHEQLVGDNLEKMAAQFAQQYRLDQPPELPK